MTAPQIDNAPGIAWRKLKYGYECRWRARGDLVKRGWEPRNVRLWAASAHELPGEYEILYIQDRANTLQNEMLVWGRGGVPQAEQIFDETIGQLIECYKTDTDSRYHKGEYRTRQHYDTLCKCVKRDLGAEKMIADLTARDLLRLNEKYINDGHLPMGRAVIGMLRTLATFGATLMQSKACRELKMLLHDMRFPMGKARTEILTFEQVVAVRAAANANCHHSVAVAQAIQSAGTFRQKDMIGEWLPISEPGLSLVVSGNEKWVKGIDWKEIDQNWMLSHVTSKRKKLVHVDLRIDPMVFEELGSSNRDDFPAFGPVIVNERTGLPWIASDFRKAWRKAADAAGVPKAVRNMDSRAGAITEALAAGVPIENVRKSATHSNQSMTSKYSRGDAEATADTMRTRVASRNKTGS